MCKKQNGRGRKILAFAIACIMTLSLIPGDVLAKDGAPEGKPEDQIRTMTVSQAGCTYGEKLPAPVCSADGQQLDMTKATVSYNGTLRSGKTYEANKAPTDAGTYKEIVRIETESGIFVGESGSFVIQPADLAKAKVKLGDALTYNTHTQTQKVAKVTLGGKTVPTSDYKVTGNKGKAAGSYTLTVAVKREYNYTGKVTKKFSIAKKVIQPTVVVGGNFSYTGKEIKPAITVKDGNKTVSKSEYTVSYSNNVNAGTGKITVKDKSGGNYKFNNVDTSFTIAKAAGNMTVKVKKQVKAKKSKLKKKAKKVKAGKLFSVKNARGKVTYKLKSVSKKKKKKYFKISKKGNLTLKKGLKKGKYKVKISVTDTGNANTLPTSSIVTVKVRVK
ncbi:MAG: hypothetical protein K5739_08905 [Lachnospiraceae bacterium]|nr:hypothetical protein [Lachnospiraceae bacterium]